MPAMRARTLLAAWLVSVSLSACVSQDPNIDIDRNPDRSYRITIARCAVDDGVEARLQEDLRRTAEQRCGRKYRWLETPTFRRMHLGTAVTGECPAMQVVANAACGE